MPHIHTEIVKQAAFKCTNDILAIGRVPADGSLPKGFRNKVERWAGFEQPMPDHQWEIAQAIYRQIFNEAKERGEIRSDPGVPRHRW